MITGRAKFTVSLLIFCFCLINSLGCRKFIPAIAGKGGIAFIVEIEPAADAAGKREEIIRRAIEITRSKLESVGASGEVDKIPGKDNQISVKIYDPPQNPETLKKFLFNSYRFELKKIVSPPNPSPVQTYPTEEAARQSAGKDQEVLPYPDRGNPSTSASSGFLIVEKNSIITGDDVRDAEAYSRTKTADAVFSVAFSLKPEGAAKLGDWSGRNINNYIGLVLNKEVKSAAFIKSQISDSGEITGRFTREEAESIALSLKSGYLPATMKIIEEKPFKN